MKQEDARYAENLLLKITQNARIADAAANAANAERSYKMKTCKIIGLLVIMIFLFGCQKQQDVPEVKQEQLEKEMEITEVIEPPEEKPESMVIIEDFEFDPETKRVSKGTIVTWKNQDSATHTVTSEDGLFDSGLLAKGITYSYTFEQEGDYEYYCTLHPNMRARVVVE